MNWKILISVFALVPAAFIVVVAPVIRNQRQLIYPSAKTVSVFLKNYSPEPVTKRFRSDESSDLAEAKGATAGRLFITNRYEFNSGFAIEAVKQTPLMHVEVVAVEKWFPNKAEARQASPPLR